MPGVGSTVENPGTFSKRKSVMPDPWGERRDSPMGHGHRLRVRVRFPEVDLMGWAHHTVYFVWFEMGRTELMRTYGLPYREVVAQGYHLPVIEAHARYRKAARYDQEVEVETVLHGVDRLTLEFRYRVWDPGTGALLAEGWTRHAVVDGTGRLRRLPAAVCDALRRWIQMDAGPRVQDAG
jgi:acyl-CoA thioester hydrolase